MTLSIELGEYTVTFDKHGGLRASRYGKPWRELTGDNLMLTLAQEVQSLRDQLAIREDKAVNSIHVTAKVQPVNVLTFDTLVEKAGLEWEIIRIGVSGSVYVDILVPDSHVGSLAGSPIWDAIKGFAYLFPSIIG